MSHVKAIYATKDDLVNPINGLITAFKACFLRKTFSKLIQEVKVEEELSPKEFWKQFIVRHGVDNTDVGWEEIKIHSTVCGEQCELDFFLTLWDLTLSSGKVYLVLWDTYKKNMVELLASCFKSLILIALIDLDVIW